MARKTRVVDGVTQRYDPASTAAVRTINKDAREIWNTIIDENSLGYTPSGWTRAINEQDVANANLSRARKAGQASRPTAPTPAPSYGGGGSSYSGGDMGGMGGGLMGQIADAYSQPLDFSSLPGLSGVSGPSQSVDFTDAFDPRFQNVNFLDPFDSRLQGVSFGGGTQGVDFSGGGPSVATLDWNEPSGNPGGSGGGKGGQAMAPPPMMQQPPMQQAPPMQGGGKGAGKGGMAAQPQPFGRLYG